MKILANLGTLKNGCTALVLEDAYHPDYAIVSGFDDSRPMGEKWNAGTYFDGNLVAFTNAIQEIELGISADRAISVIREYVSDDFDNADPTFVRDKLETCMSEDEIAACGFNLPEIEEDYENE